MDKEIQLAPNDGEDLGNEEIGNSIKVLKSNIRGMKRVLEPGCGTGRNTELLIE